MPSVINVTDKTINGMWDSEPVIFEPGIPVELEPGLDLHFMEKNPGAILRVEDAQIQEEPVPEVIEPEESVEPIEEVVPEEVEKKAKK